MSTQPDPGKTPGPKKIAIDMPKELKAVYANVALISHTPVEVVLDFAQVLPRTPHGTVQARIIMSPMHAKLLQMALAQNIQNYERQFGEIRLPNQGSPLVENFFRSTGSGSDEGKQDE
ncbi:MAG: DUF3467 domain-containing protein [Ardenticatenaceae bacterium]|nr:DUF3467 domain-containing protein [Anaerolineales bacterium]MCB8923866.1 DUF3467 domain-containing protein [Ardenticatenaceae bacterium]MCB9003355.1 DUF3467 domain-containing protein [Ardenticatenaceae bacterium]